MYLPKKILISTNPRFYISESESESESDSESSGYESDYSDYDELIINFVDMTNTIQQIEENLFNGISISNIFVLIDSNNKDIEDITELLITIYKNINFIYL